MLNSIGLYNNLAGNQTSGLAGSEQVQATSSQGAKPDAKAVPEKHLFLSGRAHKLNAINNEFFNGQAYASKDTARLVERAHEYGLISQSDYRQLTQAPRLPGGQLLDSVSTTQSLTRFLDSFEQRFPQVEGYQDIEEESVAALNNALSSAKAILGDIEGAKANPQFKPALHGTKSVLSNLLSVDHFAAMPMEDRVDLTNVVKTLDVIDKIDPKRFDNQPIDQYITVAGF